MEHRSSPIQMLGRLAPAIASAGAVIILIQTVWISYGVMMRYVFNQPSQVVTEATALLLVPCAFLGLAYAIERDALPKVTMIIDQFPSKIRAIIEVINTLLMIMIGLFFSYTAVSAFLRANKTGASSEVLSWPRAWFWAPTALAFSVACLILILKLLKTLRQLRQEANGEH